LLGCVQRLLLPSNALFVNEVGRQKLVQLLNDLYNIAFCKFLWYHSRGPFCLFLRYFNGTTMECGKSTFFVPPYSVGRF